jgi:Chaperone of endosialidase
MTRQRASLERKSLSVVFGTVVVLASIANSASAAAQQTSTAADQAVAPAAQAASGVPRLFSFSGVVKDASGNLKTGVVTLTFSIYADFEGGIPLWSETQGVQLDGTGHYTALVGATLPSGLPLDLFTSGTARWLGVQPGVSGVGEQPRVLLVGMPYALKAADADTLGGQPASAYVLAPTQNASGGVGVSGTSAAGGTTVVVTQPASPSVPGVSSDLSSAPITLSPCASVTSDGTAAANQIAKFTAPCKIGKSVISETSGKVSVGGTLQLPSTGTATATKGFNSQPTDWLASSYNSSTKKAVSQDFRWQAEPAGNNSASPSGTLNLLFGSNGVTPTETGLSVNNKGILSFASGQTLPKVTGNETVTGNVSATQLISTVATGTAPLSVASTTQVPNLNASLLGGVAASGYALVGAPNTFLASQTINGGLVVGGTTGVQGELVGDLLNANDGAVNNGTATGRGLVFGGTGSGEGIASKRTAGGNQYGLDFYTFFANRMSITGATGLVGIGTTTPYTALHIRQDVAGALGPSLTLMNGGAGAGAGGSVDFDGYDPGVSNPPTARIQSLDDGNSSSHLTFSTKSPGFGGNALVEQVRISDYGSLHVDSSSNNSLVLRDDTLYGTGLIFGGVGSGEGIASCRRDGFYCADGTFRSSNHLYGLDFYTGSKIRMYIDNTGDTSVFGCTTWSNGDHQGTCLSDARLKTNIQPLPPALDKVAQLRPVHFNWRASNPAGYRFGTARNTGLIAQEVENVFPDMVSTDEQGFKRVSYGQLPYLLLESVRELKDRNDSLRQQVSKQQAEVRQAREQNQAQQVEIQKLTRQVWELRQEQTEIAGLKARLDRLEAHERVAVASLAGSRPR